MERLTMLIDSHLLDNGELDKEYSLTDKMEFNDFSCMDIPNAVYNKLGELEDVLEKYKIENLEEYISALNEARNFAIKERNAVFSKYIKETIKTEELETELTELKQKAIVPKFQANQEIWYYHIGKNKIYSGIIEDIQWRPVNGMYYRIPNLQRDYYWIREDELFATREDAEQKLIEIKGGGKDGKR